MAEARPYSRSLADAKLHFLFLGDSSAYGVGAIDPNNSVPGRFGRAYPDADIENHSFIGARIKSLVDSFSEQTKKYDCVFLQVGGNDIFHFTKFASIRQDLPKLLDKAKKIGHRVVLLHGGNLGAVDAFFPPLSWIYSRRTKMFRDLTKRIVRNHGVIYIDMYTRLKDFPHIYEGENTCAADGFHPSDKGYKLWFDIIKTYL